MVSLGCSKNLVDAERMLFLLREEGFELRGDPAECDVVIINTCGFIEDAKKESIETIFSFAALKQERRVKVVAVTGCLAERYREEVAAEIPEADVVLGIGSNGEVVRAIKAALAGEKVALFGEKGDLSIEGDRVLGGAPYSAYLKVAEGCDNRCSYCAIPLIRGGFRSRKLEDVLLEARSLAARGVTELNLVAQDTTRYGEDLYGKLMLPELLRRLCEIPQLRWLRVLYCYPDRVTDELLEVMAREPKVLNYIDVPIQHASGTVLRRMNRRGDGASLMALVERIRAKVPGATLRTTLITGFPGETEEEFEELCGFVREARFDRLGCFPYSCEEDTPAFDLEDQLDDEVKRRRADVVMETQMAIVAEHGKRRIGEILEVLTEGFDRSERKWFGRSAMDAPDVDAKVYFTGAGNPAPGDYVRVRVQKASDYDLFGVLEEETM